MKKSHLSIFSSFALLSLFVFAIACQKKIDQPASQQDEIATSANHPQSVKDFEQVNLLGNNMSYHPARVDPTFVNGWGIAFTGTGVAWVNAQAMGLSFVLDKEGLQLRPPVMIPSPTMISGGAPTGIVFNGGNNFKLSNGQAARFIFVGDDGVLSGWNGAAGNNAIRIKDNSATASYTGLALVKNGTDSFLYAANFKSHRIEVWSNTFTSVPLPFFAFRDNHIPHDYSPFNIQALDGKLYVMYAKVGSDGDEVKHPGFGFVDVYNPDGTLHRRFIEHGQLNAPWGVAHAPAGFFMDTDADNNHDIKEKHGDDDDNGDAILVGNFGDGHINAFSNSGKFLGQLRQHGKPIEIEGLWAIMFPPTTATAIDPNRLYFAAGPGDETEGLFGYIHKN
jgi:uncharacterized protein (TIGR03118 family)